MLIVISFLAGHSAFNQNSLVTIVDSTGYVPLKPDSSIIKRIFVTINTNILKSQNNNSFVLRLPDQTITVIKKRQEVSGGRFLWHGEIQGDSGSTVLLSSVKNIVMGQIFSLKKRKIHRISYIRNNVHEIAEIDQFKLRSNSNDTPKSERKTDSIGIRTDSVVRNVSTCNDSPAEIDVMVVYTTDARIGAGGADAMEAFIFLCCYLTNLSYLNSNILHRIRLVHIEEISFVETENAVQTLHQLREPLDGILDDVHRLRNTYAADIVALILETNVPSGLAYIMDNVSIDFEDSAFCVMRRVAAADNFIFPHELGHIMGAQHDCVDVDNAFNPPYNFSHGSRGTGWKSIMSEAGVTRIPYWSNPNITHVPSGESMGTEGNSGCQANNHLVLNTTAAVVSQFRCHSGLVDDVWMKDTWDDVGNEPDLSPEVMFRSPYIWVRNDQDPDQLHQYQHQNPISSSENWIYIKMHNGNGGLNLNGNLKIYIANASTSLTWESDWVLIKDTFITVNSNSTRIVEILWNTSPDVGHYCMLARWVSADDAMHTAETPNINLNTRENNNIVWRNMNIIDLSLQMEVRAEININNELNEGAFNLELVNIEEPLKNSFSDIGKIYLELDNTIMKAWKKGGFKSNGIKRKENKVELVSKTALLSNIKLPAKQRGKIVITFSKNNKNAREKCLFQITQYPTRGSNSRKKIIGGVAYEIITYKD
jgi:hypothetical protein